MKKGLFHMFCNKAPNVGNLPESRPGSTSRRTVKSVEGSKENRKTIGSHGS